MSRSYKHYPCVKDKSCSRSGKKFANRSIRRMKNVPNGGGYKKLKESYDICDWAFYEKIFKIYCGNGYSNFYVAYKCSRGICKGS